MGVKHYVLSIFIFFILLLNVQNEGNKQNEIEGTKILTPSVSVVSSLSLNQMPIYNIKLPIDLQEFLWQKCKESNWDYEMILGLLYLESEGFDVKLVSLNTNGSKDLGLAQINNNKKNMLWYAQLSGFNEKFNPFNPKHAICACIEGLNFYREYWRTKVSEENLVYYVLNSYRMGEVSFGKYIKQKHKIRTDYDKNIFNYKNQLEERGKL
jgi:hypothetical protein